LSLTQTQTKSDLLFSYAGRRLGRRGLCGVRSS